MNLSKLARQLRREAKAHPKKAGVLALLVVVALYYWGPLMWGWFAADDATAGPHEAETSPAVASLGVAPGGATQPPKPTPQAKAPVTHPWTQLDEWMRQDPMTTPVEDVTAWKDPFSVGSPGPEAIRSDEGPRERVAASPESLGIELSGTLVGPHRRVALIGGKAYREGETIEIDRDGQRVEFELAEVHLRRIVLGLEGRRFDLRIPDGKTPAGHEE